jgi:hypothetical protein
VTQLWQVSRERGSIEMMDAPGGAMDQKDLDTYVRARQQRKFNTVVGACALVVAAIAAVLSSAGVGGHVINGILIGSIGGAFLINSEFGFFSSAVTRKTLLSIIEHQISRDPEALSYLASKH